jgi:carbamoyl-phosphate synthase large subunit
MNILVTGAGALLGQGILRCLRMSNIPCRIVATDPHPGSSGYWLSDKAYLIPLANDPTYLTAIEKIIKEERIQLLLVGTDIELPKLAAQKERLETSLGVKIVIASSKVIDIANDKWLTAEFLKKNGFPYPRSALTTDKFAMDKLCADIGFPLIAKPTDGARSVGFKIIKNEESLQQIMAYPNNLVVQEYLNDDQGEYTSGCVVYEGECKAVVTLQRDLKDGNTYRTFRDATTSQYDLVIKDIAIKLGVEGPCNFQFRIRNNEPVIFEINSRFSGTTPLRAFYGFNEVAAIIEYLFNKQEIIPSPLKEGVVLRAFSDIMLFNEEFDQFKNKTVLNAPNCVQYAFIV